MTDDRKPLVELWESEAYGAIVPCSSGVRWTNQTGGAHCAHPEAEGVFVPLAEIDISAGSAIALDQWDRAYSKDLVTQWLADQPAEDLFTAADSFDGPFGEAWLPVIVRDDVEEMRMPVALRPFIGRLVILTYPNSD